MNKHGTMKSVVAPRRTHRGRRPPRRLAALALALLAAARLPLPASRAVASTFSDLFPPASSRQQRSVQRDPDSLLREETEAERRIDAFIMRQVKFQSDWNPDPSAIPHFKYQFRRNLRMRAVNHDEPIELSDAELFEWPLLFITAHNSFAFTDEERENLRKYLLRGGRIIADDCSVGAGGFMSSFISEMRSMFPGNEIVDLTPDHPRFGSLYRVLYPFSSDPGIHNLPTQAMLINDRIGVIFEHDDIACAWEVRSPPTSANPLGIPVHPEGYVPRRAYFEWGFNLMLFMLSH